MDPTVACTAFVGSSARRYSGCRKEDSTFTKCRCSSLGVNDSRAMSTSLKLELRTARVARVGMRSDFSRRSWRSSKYHRHVRLRNSAVPERHRRHVVTLESVLTERFRREAGKRSALRRSLSESSQLQAAFLSKATMKSGTAAGETSPACLSHQPARAFVQ